MSLAAAAKRHNVVRAKIRTAIFELLADGPVGPKRLTAEVLERVPAATSEDVAAVRTILRGKTGQVEMRANKLCLSGFDRSKPITALEKEVVASLGAGKTVKEVVEACALVRNAFTARSILSALVTRGVIAERHESGQRMFAARDERQEVGVG